MNDNEHPITPPPELVQQWYDAARGPRCEQELATQAARWGADHQFAECFRWVESHVSTNRARLLCAALRPSLKDQGREALERISNFIVMETGGAELDVLKAIVEQLPD